MAKIMHGFREEKERERERERERSLRRQRRILRALA